MNLKSTPMLLLAAAFLVVTGGSLAGVGTQALFTDTAASSGNTFTTGVVDLTLAGTDDNVNNTVEFTANMVPGDKVTNPAGGLEVRNNNATGRAVELRYAITSIVEAGGSTLLAKRLDLLIGRQPAGGGTCSDASTFRNPGAAAGVDWTLIYQGDLATDILPGGVELKLVGDKAAGLTAKTGVQLSGDRTLAAGASEWLCFRITFKNLTDEIAGVVGLGATSEENYTPDDTDAVDDNPYQNLTTDIKFTFYAEQTTNNP